jgi:hypothetical protein
MRKKESVMSPIERFKLFLKAFSKSRAQWGAMFICDEHGAMEFHAFGDADNIETARYYQNLFCDYFQSKLTGKEPANKLPI